METHKRETRPLAGIPGRVILELDSPERGGNPTIMYDNGQDWVPVSCGFPTAPFETVRVQREDGKVEVPPLAFRNMLINGGFEVWQRARTGALSSSAIVGPDKWETSAVTPAQYNFSRQAGFGLHSAYCLRIERNAASTDTGGALLGQRTVVERPASNYPAPFTLSFMVRRSAVSKLADFNFAGSVGNGYVIVTGYDNDGVRGGFTATPNAQRVLVRGILPAAPLNPYFDVQIQFAWTSTASAASDYLEFDDFQLEIGDFSRFEALPFGVDLDRCRQWFQKSFDYDTAPAQNAGRNGAEINLTILAGTAANASCLPFVKFPVQMRTVPTITIYNPLAANAFVRNLIAGTDSTAAGSNYVTQNGFIQTATGLAAWTANQPVTFQWSAESPVGS